MDILHILRSLPDSETQKIVIELSKDKTTSFIKLYDPDIDWDYVIEAIFSHQKVICW